MKLQIDFDNKTIKVEDKINLGELFEKFEQLLPEQAWEDFELETHTTITKWVDPIIIREPYNPWWEKPQITWGGTRPDDNMLYCNDIKGSYCFDV